MLWHPLCFIRFCTFGFSRGILILILILILIFFWITISQSQRLCEFVRFRFVRVWTLHEIIRIQHKHMSSWLFFIYHLSLDILSQIKSFERVLLRALYRINQIKYDGIWYIINYNFKSDIICACFSTLSSRRLELVTTKLSAGIFSIGKPIRSVSYDWSNNQSKGDILLLKSQHSWNQVVLIKKNCVHRKITVVKYKQHRQMSPV